MRDFPDGVALLRLARSLLLDEILPLVPEDRRYQARLIANAMAIAAREAASGNRDLEVQRKDLTALYGEATQRPDGRPAAETFQEANERLSWRLAADLRGGQRDADPEVFAVLRRAAVARLAAVNPKALAAYDSDATDGGDQDVQ